MMEINAYDLTPGEHGFHIHESGDLSGGCSSAGGHYNPFGVAHGMQMDEVRHIGDLGNLSVNEFGDVNTSMKDDIAKLYGKQSVMARSCMIHALEDDSGQPTGNAGGRVACGQII